MLVNSGAQDWDGIQQQLPLSCSTCDGRGPSKAKCSTWGLGLFVCVYKGCGFLEFIMIQINVTSFSLQFIYKKKGKIILSVWCMKCKRMGHRDVGISEPGWFCLE